MGRALRRRNGQAFSHTIFDMLFLLVKRACMRVDGRGEGRAHTVLTRGETSGGEARMRTAGQAGGRTGRQTDKGTGAHADFTIHQNKTVAPTENPGFFHTDSVF